MCSKFILFLSLPYKLKHLKESRRHKLFPELLVNGLCILNITANVRHASLEERGICVI
jgi:hypothetical protein